MWVLKKGAEARNENDHLFLTMDGEKGLVGEWLSKYVRSMMSMMSIDVSVEAHSTRAVSYSMALMEVFHVNYILKRANWTTATIFQRHYWKDVVDHDCTLTNIIQ